MGKDFRLLFLLFFTLSFAWAEEPFRTFKTPQGKSFEGKVVGYEGQTFILSNKAGALFKVPFNALSNEDKSYLIEAVQQNRIPKGTPPPPAPSAASSSPQASQGSTAQGVDFHKDIVPILEARCNDCHKAPYEKDGRTIKPKAGLRFDEYSLLMQGNDGGPVIVAGNAEESILFEVITLPPDDDMIMPPKGDPLTADQIELFRRWIMEGASEKPTGKVVTATLSKDNENAGAQGDGVIHKAPPKKKVVFRKGSFFAHVPVPLGVSPEEALAKLQGSKPKPGEPIDFDRHVLPILNDRCDSCHHAPFDRSGRLVNPKASLRFDSYQQVMKGNLDGPVVVANDLEGSSLYTVLKLPEDDDLFMPPKGGPMSAERIDIIKRWIEEGAKPSKGGVTSTKGGIPGPDEPVSFHHHIMPLIENRCLDCHGEPYVKNGRTIKPSAGLQLNTYEWVIKGNVDGTIITPGDPADSTLFHVVTLPDDDPEIMPPKGEPLTEEQRIMIKRWILEGASEQPAAVAADPNAVPKPKETVAATGNETEGEDLLKTLAKRMSAPSKTAILAAEKTGALVTQLSERNPLVRAEFSSFASEIDDGALTAFGNIKNNISHLDISRTRVTDNALRTAGAFPNLTWLNVRNTKVGDNGLKSLSNLKYLRYLNLSGTQVTDKGIATLSQMKELEEVYLWASKVSQKGVTDLKKSLPNAKILPDLVP